MQLVLFVVGLTMLVAGAELLVRGAARLAAGFGIPPLVIGLTVVAFGTSSPELAVSVSSAMSGQGDLALGNIVGSNIANVLLILGLSALVTPLLVKSQLVRFDVPVMIGASLLVVGVALDGRIGRIDGVVLVVVLVVYLVVLLRRSRRESAEVIAEFDEEFAAPSRRPLLDGLLVAVGLAMLVIGSDLLLDAAVTFAERLGVSELVIGLTLVAVGTSLPEIATSLLAALRNERDIAVGNVVGSNIFNLLAVLGLSSMVTPDGIGVVRGALQFDLPVMVAVAVACLPIFFTGHLIARWEGALFLGFYLSYSLYLVLIATDHGAAEPFSTVMLAIVVPLTVVTIVASAVQSHQRGNRSPGSTGGSDGASARSD